MYSLLLSLAAFIEASRYALLFVSTFFGSPLVILSAGYLISIHQLEFLPAYATVVCADIVGDVGWYWIGRASAHSFVPRYGKYIGITPVIYERVQELFLKYHERILIVSKLTMGFGMALAVLVGAGMTRVPFRRYLFINLSGELLWALIPLALGYYFGNISNLVPESLRMGFVVCGFVGIIILMRYGLKRLQHKIA